MDTLSDQARAAIEACLATPDRGAVPVVVDQGFGHLVVRVGGTVARIGWNAEVAMSQQRELLTLPVLARRLPFLVPAPVRAVEPSPGLPFGALLHPWLPGTPMEPGDPVRHDGLCEEIATCLLALHAIEPSAFPDGSLVRMDPLKALVALTKQTKPWLRDRLDTNQRGTLDVLLDRAFGVVPDRQHVVCHADPWFGNMLLDDAGHLTALLDWEGLCLADPAYDLAALTYLDPPSADQTIDAYLDRAGPFEDAHGRIRAYRLFRELWGLAYALRHDMTAELEHASKDLLDLLA
jgi:aminoglycoside phosphotransferase (APT) family kinase protein